MKGLAIRLIDASTPSPGNHICARNCFVDSFFRVFPLWGHIESTMYAGCMCLASMGR